MRDNDIFFSGTIQQNDHPLRVVFSLADVPGRRSGTLVIEGGTFKTASGSAVVKNEPTGVLTINGGEFSITRERAAERITRASLPTAFPKIMKSKTTATAPGPSPKSNSPDSNIQIGTPADFRGGALSEVHAGSTPPRKLSAVRNLHSIRIRPPTGGTTMHAYQKQIKNLYPGIHCNYPNFSEEADAHLRIDAGRIPVPARRTGKISA